MGTRFRIGGSAEAGRSFNVKDRRQNHTIPDIAPRSALPLSLVAAIGGDRPYTEPERLLVEQHRKIRGKAFFADLLFAVTHTTYDPDTAEQLWASIMEHKYTDPPARHRRNPG